MTDAEPPMEGEGPTALSHRRLREGLLAWGGTRPRAPAGLAEELRAQLEAGLAAMAVDDAVRDRRDGTLWVTRSLLERVVCDGYQLDPEPFEHSRAGARGSLVHTAIDRDWGSDRSRPPAEVVDAAFRELASDRPGDPRGLAAWLNARPPAETAELCEEASVLLAGFREVWPPLGELDVVARPRLRLPLAGGRVMLAGVAGVLLRSPHRDERCRTLLVDLKTSRPDATRDRMQLRFLALLATLADGRPPFRWATHYVMEGRSEWEDLDPAPLHAAGRWVLDAVAQAVRLSSPGPVAEELAAGDWCRRCRREDTCSVAARARARGDVSHPPGTMGP